MAASPKTSKSTARKWSFTTTTDLPDSDVTTVHGVACTTPLRTVIDIAADLDRAELERVVRDCLGRGLFTIDEAMARLTQPDMTSRRGAHLLRTLLEP